MPCTNDAIFREEIRRQERVKLAERGLSDAELDDLEARTKLATERAKADAYTRGVTLQQQKDAIEAAVNSAIDEWHRDIHAKLAHDMDAIKFLGKVRAGSSLMR